MKPPEVTLRGFRFVCRLNNNLFGYCLLYTFFDVLVNISLFSQRVYRYEMREQSGSHADRRRQAVERCQDTKTGQAAAELLTDR